MQVFPGLSKNWHGSWYTLATIDHTINSREMKKLLLTTILLLAILPMVVAQNYRSILKVRLSDNTPITVSVDRRYYDEQSRVITIGNFPPGRHLLRVFRRSYRTNRPVLVYEGTVRLQPGTVSYMVIDRRTGLARVSNNRMSDRDYQTYRDDRSLYNWERNEHYRSWDDRNDRYDRDDYRDDRELRDRRDNDRRDDRYSDRDGRDNDRDRRDDRYGNNNDYYRNGDLTRKDMEDLRTRVSDRITDTEKLKMLQSVLKDRSYTTEQVRQMMSWISFESTRYDLAKWAYPNVVDKNNYWKLESEFDYNSTKSDFNEFMNNRR